MKITKTKQEETRERKIRRQSFKLVPRKQDAIGKKKEKKKMEGKKSDKFCEFLKINRREKGKNGMGREITGEREEG